MAEKHWVTKTDFEKRDRRTGLNQDVEVTHVSFDTFAEAKAYAQKRNEEHHEYMVRTNDPYGGDVNYSTTTDDRIAEGKRLGVTYIDKR